MSCAIFTLKKVGFIRVLKRTAGRIKIKITNKKITPYNLYNDMMEFKIAVIKDNKHLYAAGISGNIYGNFWTDSENFQSLGTFVTNQYGIGKLRFPTNSIPRKDINAASFYAEITYKGTAYKSHKCEANYLKYQPQDFTFILDAGGCPTPDDRSDYDFYTASTCDLEQSFFDDYNSPIWSGFYTPEFTGAYSLDYSSPTDINGGDIVSESGTFSYKMSDTTIPKLPFDISYGMGVPYNSGVTQGIKLEYDSLNYVTILIDYDDIKAECVYNGSTVLDYKLLDSPTPGSGAYLRMYRYNDTTVYFEASDSRSGVYPLNPSGTSCTFDSYPLTIYTTRTE